MSAANRKNRASAPTFPTLASLKDHMTALTVSHYSNAALLMRLFACETVEPIPIASVLVHQEELASRMGAILDRNLHLFDRPRTTSPSLTEEEEGEIGEEDEEEDSDYDPASDSSSDEEQELDEDSPLEMASCSSSSSSSTASVSQPLPAGAMQPSKPSLAKWRVCKYPKCSFRVRSDHGLNAHHSYHRVGRIPQCRVEGCGRYYSSSETFFEHSLKHLSHGQGLMHRCPVEECGKFFMSMRATTMHLLKAHPAVYENRVKRMQDDIATSRKGSPWAAALCGKPVPEQGFNCLSPGCTVVLPDLAALKNHCREHVKPAPVAEVVVDAIVPPAVSSVEATEIVMRL